MSTIIMTKGASKFIFLFFLSILLACISGLSPAKNFEHKGLEREKEQKFHIFAKGLLELLPIRAFKHDSIDPTTTGFPTTPVVNPVTTPVNMPPDNSAPTVVTVPSTNPNAGIPNLGSTPPAVPSTTPPTDTNPNPSVPITNPVTTPSTNAPVSNPVTANPTPVGGVPVTTPVTPPATTSSPATSGQSWCVAKNGAMETSLQSALDYACGKGADCSAIQQGGSCYNPNSLQNHASYAFNSYFQKNPGQTSCDFGGAAMITNSNPSTGSCVFPTSGSSTSSSATPTPGTPAPTTASSTGGAVPGSVAPTVPNGGDSGFGTMPGISDSIPPTATTSLSMSNGMQPLVGCIFLVTSIVTSKLILEI
ncbi:glucan endo-1,3-beta-glucosidase 4 [Nicotiana sylvestris]|uniref:Glucan endo-1,3-beta-glucosidase 4-like n=1 Tax=Nicotiana sylvestris TaxID=4096 RepID=A0A1U7X4Y1_NICSY|nr:PREDICTED: glucan endo-1,3-beta-glucosidase 4-like [Nicotiana sylvestris]